MTKGELKTALLNSVEASLSGMDDIDEMSPTNLTTATNGIAITLETVNPNGPYYPSTPR